ncbi:imidazole glycerol phosphate synthase cyclase subunit [Janthinobacterium sp. 17J80-10]|uniref:imidazole glycerol phosphate synthase subunit HisF n=1 Tax=Janthinobacterium sp. 17J80-10 TaxID=2497863 RepID=UPI0010059658|nr:imidazole glycerol phosphate synthase cyclase subunit [Janthinobacterium sp. 17J80-10]QAU33078.1 imidazole glycerol phosphate synthase subunit HisF [Janthinobacterium sp. 17J80-10]
MSNVRLIPRLDIKGPNLIKGIHLEGLRVVGDPQEFAIRYYQAGADELIYMDIVASLYGRNNLSDIIRRAADNVYIPITVGGGIRSVDDARHLLRSGADKVAINTAAIARPELISDVAHRFGSQAMVLSIEAKQIAPGKWEAYTDNGREKTGRDVIEWVQRGVELGAGEVLVTSVDREGTRKGFDIDLVKAVSAAVSVPVIASGGMGSADDMVAAAKVGCADAIAMADVLHYGRTTLQQLRQAALDANLAVRKI